MSLESHDPAGHLLDASPAAVLATDLNGTVLAHNERARRWLVSAGGAGQLRGRNLVDWLTPASRLLYETQVMPRLLETGRVRELILDIRSVDGERRALMLNADVRDDRDGRPTVYIVAFDASARVVFEQELVQARRAAETSHRQLSLLQEATSRLAVAQGVDDLAEVLIDAASSLLQASWVAVQLSGTAERSVDDVRLWGEVPADLNDVAEMATEMSVCRDLREIDERMPADALALRRAGVESLVVVPVVDPVSGAGAGAIRCWFRRPRSLEDDELDTLHALAVQAERVIEHLRLQERLRHLAHHDPLTGLANRRRFEEGLDRMLSRAAHAGRDCTVLFIDLDGFKSVNDELGHAAGDRLLKAVSDRLRALCREDDLIGRLGGDEFVVAASGLSGTQAEALAERMREGVRESVAETGGAVTVSASVGAVWWLGASDAMRPSSGDMIALADEVMYQAKRQGKDRVGAREWRVES